MIRGLRVFHLAKTTGSSSASAAWDRWLEQRGTAEGWRLDTCQRRVFVATSLDSEVPAGMGPFAAGVEVFEGVAAYEFLLEVATGLASQLVGETNIHGQLKTAWGSSLAEAPWIQWLLADAREIRSQYLSEVGGVSYGRLVRQLLRELDLPADGPLLLVGAGDMAESIAPWLTGDRLQILNRTPARATALAQQMAGQCERGVEVIDPEGAESAWRNAKAIVVCVPYDAAEDSRRVLWLQGACPMKGRPLPPVIHLGGNREQAGVWRGHDSFWCLDELFSRQRGADEQRQRQYRLASQACAERARHRALGNSLSHPHGWEDLPAFFPLSAPVVRWAADPAVGSQEALEALAA